MRACYCILGGTKACQNCPNNSFYNNSSNDFNFIKENIIKETYEDLKKNQKDIDPDIIKMVNDNFWDLI